ncbi:MAG: hypothetical protein KJ872_00800, partial [Alphaproteobacteria bacterium]|nr:hypothetical protein [Alphaproteobacteria bacterium]
MNMMSLQERSEEQAVPDFVRELRADFGREDADIAAANGAPSGSDTLLERFSWFRNLSLAHKVNAIFGSFLAVGVIMSLVIGIGLGELWNRYQSAGQVQHTVIAASELQSAAQDMRYHSLRALYDRSAPLVEQQRGSEIAVAAQVAAMEAALAGDDTELQPHIIALRADLDNFRADFARALDQVRGGANANAVAAQIAAQTSELLESCAQLSADLTARAEAQEAAGIAHFFNMVMVA